MTKQPNRFINITITMPMSLSQSQLMTTLTITLFLFTISSSQLLNAANADPPRDIFLLAGQSNMAGRGGVRRGVWNRFVPRESQPSPTIFRLNGQDAWEVAHEPLHVDIDVTKTCGVGPGMAFARGVQSYGGSRFGVVGLVPCAVGGTRISQWARGSMLYEQLVRRAKVAVQGGGKIRGMLWYQGESDTVSIQDAKAYKRRMERFIGDLRNDLGDQSLFIIQVALASGEGKYLETVRAAQLGITLSNVKCVDTKPLRLRLEADNLHLTTMSQVHLGLTLARAFLQHLSHTHTNAAPLANTTSFLRSSQPPVIHNNS